MITCLSITFEDFLGSSIAPQVMLPCNWLNGQPTWGGATEGNRGSRRCHTQWALLRNQKSSPATRWVLALWEKHLILIRLKIGPDNWVWWCARNVHQGILDDRPTIPTMGRYTHGLSILRYEIVLFFYPIVTTPNDLFFIIWECSYRQQSQRRKQRLQWHTPLHRLRCNFNLIWFW